jgi:hypothetical protein
MKGVLPFLGWFVGLVVPVQKKTLSSPYAFSLHYSQQPGQAGVLGRRSLVVTVFNYIGPVSTATSQAWQSTARDNYLVFKISLVGRPKSLLLYFVSHDKWGKSMGTFCFFKLSYII